MRFEEINTKEESWKGKSRNSAATKTAFDRYAPKSRMSFEVDGYKNFVFLSHVTGKCISHNSMRRMLRNIVSQNSERKIQLPVISSHILRHTACCRLAESGCDIKVGQYLLGQADIRTTMQVYNHIDIEWVRRQIYYPIFTSNAR